MRVELLLELPAEILEKMLRHVRDRVKRTLARIRMRRMVYGMNYERYIMNNLHPDLVAFLVHNGYSALAGDIEPNTLHGPGF